MTTATDAIKPAGFAAPPDNESDALWKTRRVARYLDVSPETVLRYYRQGRLSGHRLAGQPNVLRFRRQDVVAFIDGAQAGDH